MQGGTPKPVLKGDDILVQTWHLILNTDASPPGTRAGRRTLKQLMVGDCTIQAVPSNTCERGFGGTGLNPSSKHREQKLRLR